jgi:release factor glutamine methyltransferase
MQTVAAAKAWAVQVLKRARIKSPSLTADLLLAFVLQWDRIRVLSHTEDPVSEEAWNRFQNLVRRRTKGEPLQYLTGTQEFYGLDYRLGSGALIPRPETEILVEKALDLIRVRMAPSVRFLDVGTGSGCIAITIAHEVPSATGWAVDISDAALSIARENSIRHGVAERVLMIRSNRLECFSHRTFFDFIFCNPPYVALKDYDSLPTEVRDYEPHLALFGGESGLQFYLDFLPEVPSRLVAGGFLLLELGAGQDKDIKQLIEKEGLAVEAVLNDLQGIPRCLVGRKLP